MLGRIYVWSGSNYPGFHFVPRVAITIAQSRTIIGVGANRIILSVYCVLVVTPSNSYRSVGGSNWIHIICTIVPNGSNTYYAVLGCLIHKTGLGWGSVIAPVSASKIRISKRHRRNLYPSAGCIISPVCVPIVYHPLQPSKDGLWVSAAIVFHYFHIH